MKAQVWLVVLLGAWLMANLATGGDGKKDEDKIQGTWKAEKDGKTGLLTFSGNTFAFIIERDDKKETYKGTFKMNAQAKPKEIDMTVTESPKESFQNKTSLGIYDLDGDAYKWCANEPGKTERPDRFSDDFLKLEFKREKK